MGSEKQDDGIDIDREDQVGRKYVRKSKNLVLDMLNLLYLIHAHREMCSWQVHIAISSSEKIEIHMWK